MEKGSVLEDTNKISKIVAPYAEEEHEFADVKKELATKSILDSDDEVAYILRQYFTDHDPSEVDFEYIRTIARHFENDILKVAELVNTYTTSFAFKDMDIIDQMIFVLWYTEYTQVGTPKEVLLNEMIEIAKRYGDESSSKLINGIWHKLLSNIVN
jgi:transcription antitermination protein NusB